MRIRVLVPLLLPALLAGCGDGGASPDPSPTSETGVRAAAIEQAREVIGPVAVGLGQAALTLGEVAAVVADDPSPDSIAAVETAADDLETAAAATDLGDDVDAEVDDVAAAVDALDEAAATSEEIVADARALATLLADLQEVDAQLFELVAAWDEPGSRSQQLARLDETAQAADALAEQVAGQVDAGCAHPTEVRVRAAEAVADATRELHDLVAGYQGERFDQRRAELGEDPYGFGAPLGEAGAVTAEDCALLSGIDGGVEEVTEALQDVESALNPPDLAS